MLCLTQYHIRLWGTTGKNSRLQLQHFLTFAQIVPFSFPVRHVEFSRGLPLYTRSQTPVPGSPFPVLVTSLHKYSGERLCARKRTVFSTVLCTRYRLILRQLLFRFFISSEFENLDGTVKFLWDVTKTGNGKRETGNGKRETWNGSLGTNVQR